MHHLPNLHPAEGTRTNNGASVPPIAASVELGCTLQERSLLGLVLCLHQPSCFSAWLLLRQTQRSGSSQTPTDWIKTNQMHSVRKRAKGSPFGLKFTIQRRMRSESPASHARTRQSKNQITGGFFFGGAADRDLPHLTFDLIDPHDG